MMTMMTKKKKMMIKKKRMGCSLLLLLILLLLLPLRFAGCCCRCRCGGGYDEREDPKEAQSNRGRAPMIAGNAVVKVKGDVALVAVVVVVVRVVLVDGDCEPSLPYSFARVPLAFFSSGNLSFCFCPIKKS